MAQHWYAHPLACLEDDPERRILFVQYDDLVRDPEQTVSEVYRWLDLPVGSEFADALRAAAERARGYRSSHHYTLDQMGLTREQIVADYRPIFERFGFDTRAPAD